MADWFDQNAQQANKDWFDQNTPQASTQEIVPAQSVGEIAQHAGTAAVETAKGFIPKSLGEVLGFVTPVVGSVQDVGRGYGMLKDALFWKPINEATAENFPETQIIPQAEKTAPYSEERFKAGFGALAQLGMAAIGGRGLAKTTEALPQIPETSISDAVQPQTQIQGGIENAQQIISPAQVHGDVQYASRPQESVGEVPANVGSEGVQALGQGEIVQQTPQEVGTVPQPEQPIEAGARPVGQFSADAKARTVELKVPGFEPTKADYPESKSYLADKGVAGKIYLETPKDFETENPPPRDFMVVEDSAIAKSLQNQGYGTHLYNEALKLAKSEGYKGIASHASDRNLASDSLWQKMSQGKKAGYDIIIDPLPDTGSKPVAPVSEPTETATAQPLTQTSGVETPPTVSETTPKGQATKPPIQVTDTQPHVSSIANRFIDERVSSGELGEVVPGSGYSTRELAQRGLQMPPEEISQHISDLVNKTGDPIKQGMAVRAEEARLSQRNAELSRIAEENPKDLNAKVAADNAFKDVTDFHNGPVAQLKQNFHAQGMALQGDIPVDLSTFNGLREKWLKDTGESPPPHMENTMRKTAQDVRDAVEAENGVNQRLSQDIDRAASRRKLPTVDEVSKNIQERIKVEPCIT